MQFDQSVWGVITFILTTVLAFTLYLLKSKFAEFERTSRQVNEILIEIRALKEQIIFLEKRHTQDFTTMRQN